MRASTRKLIRGYNFHFEVDKNIRQALLTHFYTSDIHTHFNLKTE